MSGSGRGITGWGSCVPYRRLDRSTIAAVAGSGGGHGTRCVASYDEDSTTMGVEAARAALQARVAETPLDSLWFTTTAPAYADKTNATAIHAALGLGSSTGAYDMVGAVRSTIGALRAALAGTRPSMVVASDVRTGLPGGPDEASGGDAAAALLIGSEPDEHILAELRGSATRTAEFLDRWRVPGDQRSKLWEERFGALRYVELGQAVWDDALATAGIDASAVDRVVVAGTHDRAVKTLRRSLVASSGAAVVDHAGTVGNAGAAEVTVGLAAALEESGPGEIVAIVSLADGADAYLWRTTEHLRVYRPTRTVASQIDRGGEVSYGQYLAWRGMLEVEPPRRPEPTRPSASAAGRAAQWKYGFVGSESAEGEVHLPPLPTDTRRRPMAGATGVVVTFTIDRLAYSPSPPVVFAIVDFAGGGRLPVELTDIDADEVEIGMAVEMTFRRLFTADGIHNYFWKARPRRM